MTDNNAHDKEWIDQFERQLASGKASGGRLLDDLTETVPHARPVFQQNLENRLIAQMHQQNHPTNRRRKRMPFDNTLPVSRLATRLPITLVATLLIVIAAGSALFLMSLGPSSETGLTAAIQEDGTATWTVTPIQLALTPIPGTRTVLATSAPTETPPLSATPIATIGQVFTVTPLPLTVAFDIPTAVNPAATGPSGLQPVVIAIENLEPGTQITSDMVAVVYWPGAIVPSGVDLAVETVEGLYVQDRIARWQPLLKDLHLSATRPEGSIILPTPRPGDSTAAILPESMVAVSIPLASAGLYGDPTRLQLNTPVDVYATIRFLEVDDEGQAITPDPISLPADAGMVIERVVERALVVHVGEFGQEITAPEDADIITLAVTLRDAVILTYFVDAGIPLMLVPQGTDVWLSCCVPPQ